MIRQPLKNSKNSRRLEVHHDKAEDEVYLSSSNSPVTHYEQDQDAQLLQQHNSNLLQVPKSNSSACTKQNLKARIPYTQKEQQAINDELRALKQEALSKTTSSDCRSKSSDSQDDSVSLIKSEHIDSNSDISSRDEDDDTVQERYPSLESRYDPNSQFQRLQYIQDHTHRKSSRRHQAIVKTDLIQGSDIQAISTQYRSDAYQSVYKVKHKGSTVKVSSRELTLFSNNLIEQGITLDGFECDRYSSKHRMKLIEQNLESLYKIISVVKNQQTIEAECNQLEKQRRRLERIQQDRRKHKGKSNKDEDFRFIIPEDRSKKTKRRTKSAIDNRLQLDLKHQHAEIQKQKCLNLTLIPQSNESPFIHGKAAHSLSSHKSIQQSNDQFKQSLNNYSLNHVANDSTTQIQRKLTKTQVKGMHKDGITRQGGLQLITVHSTTSPHKYLLTIFMLITLIHPSVQLCPNRNLYVEYKDPIRIQSTRSQTPIELTKSKDVDLSYLEFQMPCIYPVNNVTNLVINSKDNQYHIIKYNNVETQQGKIEVPFSEIIGVMVKDSDIYIQHCKENTVFNVQHIKPLELMKLFQQQQAALNEQTEFQIHYVEVNKFSGFYDYDIQKGKFQLMDGFINHLRESTQINHPSEIMEWNATQSPQSPPPFNKINKFESTILKKHFAAISTGKEHTIGAPNSIAQYIQLKQDNIKLGCKQSNDNGLWSCQYQIMLQSTKIGSMLWSDSQFSLAIVAPLAVEIYRLQPLDFSCLQSTPDFQYHCFCGISFNRQPDEVQDIIQDRHQHQEDNQYTTTRKRFASSSSGCGLKFKPGNQFVTVKEKLGDEISRLYKISLKDTCTITTSLFKSQSSIYQGWYGLSVCDRQDSFNSENGIYNLTITNLNNNNELIREDYLKANKDNHFSYSTTDYFQNSQLIDDICSVRIDDSNQIQFPIRKFSLQEEDCYDNQAQIKQVDDHVSKNQNISNLISFTRFDDVKQFDQTIHTFHNLQVGQLPYKIGDHFRDSDPLIQLLNADYNGVLQYAYCVSLQRVVQLLFANEQYHKDGVIKRILVIDNGDVQESSAVLLHTNQDKIVCLQTGENSPNCPEFIEHSIRYVDSIQLDGILEFNGKFLSVHKSEFQASGCNLVKSLKLEKEKIVEGEICCDSSGILRFIIDDGNQDHSFKEDLQVNKCIDFSKNNIFLNAANNPIFIIKLPGTKDKMDNIQQITNNIFNQTKFKIHYHPIQGIDYQFENQLKWWQQVIMWLEIFVIVIIVWICINSILSLKKSSKQDGYSSIWSNICGGACLTHCLDCLKNTQKYKLINTQNNTHNQQFDNLQEEEENENLKQTKRKQNNLFRPISITNNNQKLSEVEKMRQLMKLGRSNN